MELSECVCSGGRGGKDDFLALPVVPLSITSTVDPLFIFLSISPSQVTGKGGRRGARRAVYGQKERSPSAHLQRLSLLIR